MKIRLYKLITGSILLIVSIGFGLSFLGYSKAQDEDTDFWNYTLPIPTVRTEQVGYTNETVGAQVFWELASDAEQDAYGFIVEKQGPAGRELAANLYPADRGFADLTDGGFYYDEAVAIGDTYIYYVKTYDRAGKESDWGQAIINIQGIQITDITVSDLASSSAKISWKTDVLTQGKVEYGLDTNYGSTSDATEAGLDHSTTLSNLQANKTYHFKIKVYPPDEEDQSQYSGDQSLTTAQNLPPIVNIDISTGSYGNGYGFGAPWRPVPNNVPNQFREFVQVLSSRSFASAEVEYRIVDNVVDLNGQQYTIIASGSGIANLSNNGGEAVMQGVVEPAGAFIIARARSLTASDGQVFSQSHVGPNGQVFEGPSDEHWYEFIGGDLYGHIPDSDQALTVKNDGSFTYPLWANTYFAANWYNILPWTNGKKMIADVRTQYGIYVGPYYSTQLLANDISGKTVNVLNINNYSPGPSTISDGQGGYMTNPVAIRTAIGSWCCSGWVSPVQRAISWHYDSNYAPPWRQYLLDPRPRP